MLKSVRNYSYQALYCRVARQMAWIETHESPGILLQAICGKLASPRGSDNRRHINPSRSAPAAARAPPLAAKSFSARLSGLRPTALAAAADTGALLALRGGSAAGEGAARAAAGDAAVTVVAASIDSCEGSGRCGRQRCLEVVGGRRQAAAPSLPIVTHKLSFLVAVRIRPFA